MKSLFPLIFLLLLGHSCLADETMLNSTIALAKQGVLAAQTDLARYYTEHNDKQQAFYWNKMAAEQGHSDAAFNTAIAYDAGDGTEQNLSQAAYWYEKAARLGNSAAAYNLGILYDEGTGISMDKVAASMWLELSILLGHEPEQASEALDQASLLLRQSVIDELDRQAQQLFDEIQKNHQ